MPTRLRRLVGLLAALLISSAAGADDALERGRYLVHAGGCIECHTEDADTARPLAGGRRLDTPFGIFYSPNITPDPETGIGSWTDDEFVRAFHEGVSPAGDHYYPSFPYTSYTGVSRADLLDMKAYLFSLEPVRSEAPAHDLAWYISTRLAAGAWKLRHFEPERFKPEPGRSSEWNRGAYLVRHLGHCGECHTPRSVTGAPDASRELAGAQLGDETIPNITPHRDDGIGRWSESDIEYFLDIGMLPDGDFTGSSMSGVIDTNTSRLSAADRLAIATYLRSLPALASAD